MEQAIAKFTPGGTAVPGQTRSLADIMAGVEARLGKPATDLVSV